MQQLLIQYILDPLCRRMEPVPGKVKNALVLLGGSGLLGTMFLRGAEIFDIRYIFWYALNLFLFCALLLGILPEKIQPIKCRKSLVFFWMAAAVLRCVSGVTQNTNYFAEGILLLLVWPTAMLIVANCDHTRLLHLGMTLLRGSLLVFLALSFLLRPITPGEYTFLCENANSSAHYLAAVSTMLTLSVLYDRGRKWIPDAILLGLAWTMNFYTNSRTGLLAIVVALIGGLAIFLTRPDRKRVLRLALAVAAAAVFFLTLVYAFQLRGFLKLPYFDPETKSWYHATREELWLLEGEEFARHMEQAQFFDSSVFTNRSKLRFDAGDKTLDRYSTGRLSLWHSCIVKLNLTGHPSTKDQFHTSTRLKLFSTAHMVILQFAFESGIPMGICYLIMNILSGLAAIGHGWRGRFRDWSLAPLMVTLCFGVLSLMESCTGSLQYLGTTLYYFALAWLMAAPGRERL